MNKAKKLLIDTDIIIDYLRGIALAIKFIEKNCLNATCAISTITVAELYAGVREGKERQTLTQFLSLFEIIELDQAIAEKGGLFRRDYGKSHNVGLADALIAATCENIHATLVTLNKKHYPMMDVHVPYKKMTSPISL
jgi:predicted nucleic acid-binding protein